MYLKNYFAIQENIFRFILKEIIFEIFWFLEALNIKIFLNFRKKSKKI